METVPDAVVGLAMVSPFLVICVVLDIQLQKFDMRDCLCNAQDHRRHRVQLCLLEETFSI